MWRVLPFLLVVVVLTLVVLVATGVLNFGDRWSRRAKVRDDIEAETLRWQAEMTRDDIRRHRDRMNRNIDDQFDEMRGA